MDNRHLHLVHRCLGYLVFFLRFARGISTRSSTVLSDHSFRGRHPFQACWITSQRRVTSGIILFHICTCYSLDYECSIIVLIFILAYLMVRPTGGCSMTTLLNSRQLKKWTRTEYKLEQYRFVRGRCAWLLWDSLAKVTEKFMYL